MQLKDVTPIIKAILDERNKIPLMINTERYIPNWKPNQHGNAMRGGIRKALRIIEQAPVVDVVEVVHAYWKEHLGEGYTGCSKCDFIPYNISDNFCPNCGAKMDGGAGK